MIQAVGIDSVDVARMESMIKRKGFRALKRLFSAGEIDYCGSRPAPAQHYGARFAAKEACMKCLGRGIWGGMAFKDIETVRNTDGSVRLVLHGQARERFETIGGTSLHVSLTHTETIAVAMVVIETGTAGDAS
ncbi:MAG: holo-ACP synthase [Syntrophales bacterium]|jgi:holo-[acyl-carrier protein] synthase|nr:holo-ACP synthase [Syntrophales bacterium]MCK9527971.1 holo-ACP synthase [Syntrophales bacterium]MDX9921453.1 holo-ACP synthase [Syntrophales bacterium]